MHQRPGNEDVERDRAWQDGRGLGSARVRVWAFGISVVAHIFAVVLYTAWMDVIEPGALDVPIETEADDESGLELLRLLELNVTIERPEDPEEIARISVPEADTRVPRIPGPVAGELTPPGQSAADRLRPVLLDPRLWAEPPPEFYALSDGEREELLLSHRIVEWYDSIALARAAEDRFTDWTFRDSGGGRWGVADGRIYLGDTSIPLPLDFGTPVGLRDETNYRIWEFDEIQRQSRDFIIQQTWRERAEAIRARRDRERAAVRPDTSGVYR